MRDVLGVRDSTPLRVVLAELGRYPLEFHMAKLEARYCERLATMPANSLPRRALAANLLLAERQRAREEHINDCIIVLHHSRFSVLMLDSYKVVEISIILEFRQGFVWPDKLDSEMGLANLAAGRGGGGGGKFRSSSTFSSKLLGEQQGAIGAFYYT